MYFVFLGEWNPPKYVIHTRGRLFSLTRGKHVLKRAENHRCKVNLSAKLACSFSTFFKVSQRDFFTKLLAESKRSDRL